MQLALPAVTIACRCLQPFGIGVSDDPRLQIPCKYAGEPGHVRIEIGHVEQRVVLAVEDSGPGIPQAERLLLDRF